MAFSNFSDFFQNYEIRQLPAAKWACTKLTNVDPMEDPMRNWQENVCTTLQIHTLNIDL